MSLENNIIKLLENQDKETPVSVDLLYQRLGYPKEKIKKKLRELNEKGEIESLQGKRNVLYFKK